MSIKTTALISGTALLLALLSVHSQAENFARTPDGKPDLNGIWQALGSAHWNLEAHMAAPGPVAALGALGAIPGGIGVIEGAKIPYLPQALKTKLDNQANWLARDPVVKCYLPGVPRATYLPFPLQIFQAPDATLITYEFAGADRIVHMNRPDYIAQVDSWMGHNLGHWEGDTFVVVVTGQLPSTWLDSAGNHHSEQLTVVERYTPMGPNHIQYRATMTDPLVYSRPWSIEMPLYRRMEKYAQLLDFKCIEFAEEMLYGHLRKK